ncbi:MAG: hypothetical protein IKI05_01755, partial [Bacteroidaceae bacterium]|nr:hypothetical protein [Bacteroidaceae bacterium]
MAAEDAPPSGLSPTQKLPPLKPAATAQIAQAAQPAAPRSEAKPSQTLASATSNIATPTPTPSITSPRPAQKVQASPTPPRLKTLSISGTAPTQTATATTNQPQKQIGQSAYTIADVRLAWRQFADRLPQEQRAMAERMKGIEPQEKDATTAEVVVENKVVLDQLNTLKPQLIAFIQEKVNNHLANITFRIREAEERHRAFSDKEKLATMLEKSKPLQILQEKLALQLA